MHLTLNFIDWTNSGLVFPSVSVGFGTDPSHHPRLFCLPHPHKPEFVHLASCTKTFTPSPASQSPPLLYPSPLLPSIPPSYSHKATGVIISQKHDAVMPLLCIPPWLPGPILTMMYLLSREWPLPVASSLGLYAHHSDLMFHHTELLVASTLSWLSLSL